MIKLYITLAIVAGAFFGGWQGHSWYQDSKDLAATQKAISDAVAKARADDKIKHDAEIELAKSQQKTKTVFKTVTNEVTKYVTKNVIAMRECLDDAGLMLWNTANTGAFASGKTTYRFDATVPRIITDSGGQDRWFHVGEPYGGGGDLPRVQEPTQQSSKIATGDRF